MKSFREANYYELLEVPIQASVDEIRAAYERALERSAAQELEETEPDHRIELWALLDKALAVLTNAAERMHYDRCIGLREVSSTPTDGTTPMQLAMDELLESAAGARLPPDEPRPSYVPFRSRPRDGQEFFTPPGTPQPNGGELVHPKPLAELEHAPVLAEESAIANAEAALVHASARGQHLRNRPVEIPPDADFNGEFLRQIREGRGLVIQEVAERTRIPMRHLENIEADRYNHLPATVYLRGILTSLSRELGLDPVRVSRSYLALVDATKAKGR